MRELATFVTQPEPCSYLPGRSARTELHLAAGIEAGEYGALLRTGYRRFGLVLFRPACEVCRECLPLRVAVNAFRPSRSQRRVLRRNFDVRVEVGEPDLDEERMEVYRAFHQERARTVGWKEREVSPEEYRRTFLENIAPTLELRYRLRGRLAAVAYVDRSPAGLNSIYCYHHPDFRRRSLGSFDILTEIELAARLGLPHLYLGFYVARCRSLEYKARFQPAEVLRDGRWVPFAGMEPREVGRAGGRARGSGDPRWPPGS